MKYSRFFIVLLAVPGIAFAHFPENMGIQKPNVLLPAIPNEYDEEPIVDLATQRMALEMDTADCDDLKALNDDVKYAVFLTSMFLQRPGALSRIIGPDCQFLGEVQKIASIEDNSLTVSTNREILYFLPELNMLFVSNANKNSIAYGIKPHEDLGPLASFVSHREEAQSAAQIAQKFSTMVADHPAPIFDPSAQRQSTVAVAPSGTSSSAKSARSATEDIGRVPPNDDGTSPPLGSPQAEVEGNDGASPTQDAQNLPETYEESPPTYTDTESEELPRIQPLGPKPKPEPVSSSPSGGMLALIFFSVIVLIITAVIVLKTRVDKKDAYLR